MRPIANPRVAVVGPPLSASGGIGRMMTYALDAVRGRNVSITVLDTRGPARSPWTSLLPLVRTCVALLRMAAGRRVDVAHVNVSASGSALRKGVVVRICRAARIPVVLHLHASSFPEFYDALPGWSRRWVRRTFAAATRVIVLGQGWRDYVVETLAVPRERVVVLANATPPGLPAAPARRCDGGLRLLFLGRLGDRKGVPELLAALAGAQLRHREWRATLAGDGEIDRFRRLAAELGLADRVDFPGWVGPERVSALLSAADLVVLPSHAEGLPMSVLEAFAAGVPVVCTPVGGLAELVRPDNGLLVPPGDPDRLAAAILQLFDDELRARLAAGALATWQADHSIEDYVLQLMREWRAAAGAARTGLDSGRLSFSLG